MGGYSPLPGLEGDAGEHGGGGGGQGGPGGGSGGGSFAAYLWNSSVSISSSHLVTSTGGNGGNGSDGQPGGNGGGGGRCGFYQDCAGEGPGGSEVLWQGNCSGGLGEQDDASNGARGGPGGNGGHGTPGGGAGGPSIGILVGGSSTLTPVDVTYTIGQPGFGGPSPGNAGPQGTAATILELEQP